MTNLNQQQQNELANLNVVFDATTTFTKEVLRVSREGIGLEAALRMGQDFGKKIKSAIASFDKDEEYIKSIFADVEKGKEDLAKARASRTL